MTTTISEHTGQLVVTRCWCGVQHAIPETLYKMQAGQKDRGEAMTPIYCPLGHQWVRTADTEADKLKRELEFKDRRLASERAAHDQTKAELRETESRRRAEKGAKTKLKKRVAHGVCPCCQRTFKQLADHMAAMHPDYVQEAKAETVN